MSAPFRLGFVTGATPDKWARIFEQRAGAIELVPVTEDEQEHGVRERTLDMVLARLPVDREDLHCIPLYEERPVAVMGVEHVATVVEELTTEDLADEQLVHPERSGWRPAAEQLDWPAMSVKAAVETVAAGTGVLVVPMSVARLHHRKDVTFRPVTDLPTTTIGLVWRTDHDDERVQTFIGVVRGRTANSSRR